MKLTKSTFNAEDIIQLVNGNTNFTVKTSVLEEWLASTEKEMTIGRKVKR